VPFDGDLVAATRYVTQENVRPSIREQNEDDDEDVGEKSCSAPMANLIRQCWLSSADERPSFNWVIEELIKELSFFDNEQPAGGDGSDESSGDEEEDLRVSLNFSQKP
jgi:hypothetical protein